MNYNIILSEEARNDEIVSFNFYEMQRSGLGLEFLDALGTVIPVCEKILNISTTGSRVSEAFLCRLK